ncbi:MAG: hypothetical protein JXK05_09580 [Campylobacterales bacterium]|nr:hypothetical protein [Campylobacterales bacterium]
MKMTDVRLCEFVGMTPQNLRATYSKSKDPKKRMMYLYMFFGAMLIEDGVVDLDEIAQKKQMLNLLTEYADD